MTAQIQSCFLLFALRLICAVTSFIWSDISQYYSEFLHVYCDKLVIIPMLVKKNRGYVDQYQTTTKQNQTWTWEYFLKRTVYPD